MMTKVILFGTVLGAGWLLALLAMSEANEAALIGSITPTIVAIGAIITGVLSYLAAKAAREEAKEAKEQVAKNTAVTESVSKLVDGQHTVMVNALKTASDKVGELEKEKVAAMNLETFKATIKEVLAVTPGAIPAAVADRVTAAPVAPAPAPPPSRPGVPPFPPHRPPQ